jgi:hypothetical protein
LRTVLLPDVADAPGIVFSKVRIRAGIDIQEAHRVDDFDSGRARKGEEMIDVLKRGSGRDTMLVASGAIDRPSTHAYFVDADIAKQGDELAIRWGEEVALDMICVRQYALGFKAEAGEVVRYTKLRVRGVDDQCNGSLREQPPCHKATGADHIQGSANDDPASVLHSTLRQTNLPAARAGVQLL